MRRALHAPALHFLAAGGLLFALRIWWLPSTTEPDRPRIVLTGADVERLRAAWTAQHGAPPDGAGIRALLDDAVDEEILYREAIAAGLDRRDPLVQTRLVKLASFLGDASEGDGAAGTLAPDRLDLAAHDIVVRRHLIQVMRLALAHVGPDDMPSDADLRAYLDGHEDRFRQGPLVRLTHVFLARDRHGSALAHDATRLLDELRRDDASPDTAPSRGEPFLRGAHPPAASPAALDRLFGPGFAAAIDRAPVGRWIGPVAGSYGLHLVWIHERTPARMPSPDAVRAQLTHGFLEAAGRERLRAALARLRVRYQISIGP